MSKHQYLESKIKYLNIKYDGNKNEVKRLTKLLKLLEKHLQLSINENGKKNNTTLQNININYENEKNRSKLLHRQYDILINKYGDNNINDVVNLQKNELKLLHELQINLKNKGYKNIDDKILLYTVGIINSIV